MSDRAANATGFNALGARKHGVDDQRIIDHMLANPGKPFMVGNEAYGYDVRGALDAGATPKDIIDHVTSLSFDTVTGTFANIGRGITYGLTEGVGAPADLLTGAVNMLGADQPPPALGSESLRGPLRDAFGDTLVPESPEDVAPSARAGFEGGRTVGQSLVGALLPIVGIAARRGVPIPRPIGSKESIFEPILKRAQTSPGTATALETSAAVSAGVAGAAAFATDPTSNMLRFTMELVAGAVDPARLVALASKWGFDTVRDIAGALTSKGSRMRQGAERAQEILIDAGKDPAKVARDLMTAARRAETIGLEATAGQLSGDEGIIALERELAKNQPKFRGEVNSAFERSQANLKMRAEELTQMGDPDSLRQAAILQNKRVKNILSEIVVQQEQQVAENVARLSGGGRGDIQEISSNIIKILEKSLKSARKVEKDAWNLIPQTIEMDGAATVKALDNLKIDLFETEELTGVLKLIDNEVSRGTGPLTSGRLLKIRSRALREARSARSGANPDWELNSRLMQIADGALEDLSRLSGDAVDNARSISIDLNDKFSRSFAGDALGTRPSGEAAISPELVLQRAYGSGGNTGDVKLGQIEEAARLGGQTTLSEQESFLRTMAKTVLERGKISPQKLKNFLADNDAILAKFPALLRELRTVEGATQALKRAEETAAQGARAVKERTAFGKLIKTEDPALAMRQVLDGGFILRDLGQLIRLAKKSGAGAVGGLTTSTLDAVYAKARQLSSNSGQYWTAVGEQLITTLGRGKRNVTLLQVMQSNGLLTAREARRLKHLIRQGQKIERSLTSPVAVDPKETAPNLFEMLVKVGGARAGVANPLVPGGGAGTSLQAAGMGSKLAKFWANILPGTKVDDFLRETIRNPRAFALLLRRPRTEKQARDILRQMNAYAISAGLKPLTTTTDEERQEAVQSVVRSVTPQTVQGETTPSGMGVAGALLRQRSLQDMENANAP